MNVWHYWRWLEALGTAFWGRMLHSYILLSQYIPFTVILHNHDRIISSNISYNQLVRGECRDSTMQFGIIGTLVSLSSS